MVKKQLRFYPWLTRSPFFIPPFAGSVKPPNALHMCFYSAVSGCTWRHLPCFVVGLGNTTDFMDEMHIGSSCCTAVFVSPPLFADNQEASHDTQWLLPSNQIKDIWIHNQVCFSEFRDLGRCHAVAESDYNHLETHVNALRSSINVTNIQREARKRVGGFTNTEYVYTCFMWTICS